MSPYLLQITKSQATIEILIMLLVAFIIGFIIAWLLFRNKTSSDHTEDLSMAEKRDLEKQLSECHSQRDDLSNKLTEASSKVATLEAEVQKMVKTPEPLAPSLEEEVPNETPTEDAFVFSAEQEQNAKKLGFTKAQGNKKDDLKRISGVGPFIEKKLNNLGIYTFSQISEFNEETIDKVTEAIEFFPGRIKRDNWVRQAGDLMNE